jgi:hypothetical protein
MDTDVWVVLKVSRSLREGNSVSGELSIENPVPSRVVSVTGQRSALSSELGSSNV